VTQCGIIYLKNYNFIILLFIGRNRW